MNATRNVLARRYAEANYQPKEPLNDAIICVNVGENVGENVGKDVVTFKFRSDGLAFVNEHPNFTLYFDSLNSLEETLGDMAAALEAFGEGRFRSSGYIFWSFQTLRMFRPNSVL